MKERMASCSSEGRAEMAPGVFDSVTEETRSKIDAMPEGEAKMEAQLRFAKCCLGWGEDYTALGYYERVMRCCIDGSRLKPGCSELAQEALRGLSACSGSSDEGTWEMASELLAGYEALLESKDKGKAPI